MDTAFAKVMSDPDGRDYIVIEGLIIPLAIENVQENNRIVDRITRDLRQPRRVGEVSAMPNGSGSIAGVVGSLP